MSNELDMSALLDVAGLPGISGDDQMPIVYEPTVLVPVESHPKERNIDLESDYAVSRESLNQQQQMLMAMATIALENAKNSESPRHVEAFTALMTAMTNTTTQILKVHKEMAAITNEAVKSTGSTTAEPSMKIENATVFVGSPADLMNREGSQFDIQSSAVEINEE